MNWVQLAKLVFLVFCNVAGQAAENISVIFWVGDLMKYGAGGPYFILFVLCAFFPVFFGICLLIATWRNRKSVGWSPFILDRRLHRLMFIIGFYNAINGFLILYASPAQRTPPIVQGILGNSGLLVSAIGSKFILKKGNNYFRPLPILSGIFILGAILLSIAPDFAHGHTKFSGTKTVWWSICFGLGFVPGVLYNTYQEKVCHEPKFNRLIPSTLVWTQSFCILFWGCLWLFFFICIGFGIDLIPGFGFSTIHTFGNHFQKGFECNFSMVDGLAGTDGSCSKTFLYGAIFFFGYVLSYVAACKLNRESTDFNMVTQIFVAPVVVIFWIIFKDLDPSSERTPAWSVYPALILTVIGAILWKWWERKNNIVPIEQQHLLEHGRTSYTTDTTRNVNNNISNQESFAEY